MEPRKEQCFKTTNLSVMEIFLQSNRTTDCATEEKLQAGRMSGHSAKPNVSYARLKVIHVEISRIFSPKVIVC